tara:strand:- start:50 stop:550 length:501 start_codon:yes stop_codon:yes gene_type:complete
MPYKKKTSKEWSQGSGSEFTSTKRFGPISVGHRQWRDKGHCKFAHGYGRYVEFTFACEELDDKGWVMDFGGLKDVKKRIEKEWDHRMLIASDDPLLDIFKELHGKNGVDLNIMNVELGWGPGIEASCKFMYDTISTIITVQTDGRVWIKKVQIWEHENNSATYEIE